MNSLAIMILFLTRIPLPYRVRYDEDELAKGIKLMPLVGLLIGGILYGGALLLEAVGFERGIVTVIVWTLYIAITGGLHIDGLADTFDGVYSNRDRERVLEIMKDSQIGTFGVLGIIAVLGLGMVSSYYLDYIVYFVFPIAGRSIALIVCAVNRYAREDGMGKAFIDRCGKTEMAVGIISGILVSFCSLGMAGTIAIVLALSVSVAAARKIDGIIGGITGDVIGFTIELSQSVFLVAIYAALKIMAVLN